MIIDWHGYPNGAITADNSAQRYLFKNGNHYIINRDGIYNVHPRVTACQTGDESTRIEYEAGVYPIRWKLDYLEIYQLLEA